MRVIFPSIPKFKGTKTGGKKFFKKTIDKGIQTGYNKEDQ
jgi:hypothetical protein